MPSSSSTSNASGAMPSPHTLSRGKSARSRTSTRALGAASRAAAAHAAPAGPPPTTTTSQCSTGQTLGAVVLGEQRAPAVPVVGRRLGRGDEVEQDLDEPVGLVEVRPVAGRPEDLD